MKMKRTVGILLVLAASVLVTPACKKKNEDPKPEETPETPASPGISMKIDGVTKTFIVNKYEINKEAIEIGGVDIEGNNLMLGTYDKNMKFVGTYSISPTGDGLAAYSTINPIVMHNGETGTLVITKLENDKISGTFNFTEKNGIVVTEGVFTDVPKQ